MEELKPCPFCGGEAHIITFKSLDENAVNCYRYNVMCGGCCVSQPFYGYRTKEKAIEAWNRRTKK